MGSLRYFLFDDAYKNDNKEDITLYYRYLFFIIIPFEIFSYIIYHNGQSLMISVFCVNKL